MAVEHRTRALVLRTFDQGESDRLVHLYTEDLGRISAIAKGARRSKRRFPGTLELFCVLDVRVVDPPRSSLMRLEGARLVRSFDGLVDELTRYAIACQLVELLDRLTAENQPAPELLHFAVGALEVISEEEPDRLLAVLVLAKTLARLGYRPQLQACVLCGSALADGSARASFDPRHGGAVCSVCEPIDEFGVPSRLLAALELGIRTPLRDRGALGLSDLDVRRAEGLFRRFFQFHIGFELRTSRFLLQMLERGAVVDDGAGPRDTAPSRTGLAPESREFPRPDAPE